MTEDEKKVAIDLWEKGWSGGKIGELLHVSRNSIIGFISRQRRNGHVFERPIEKWHSIRKTTPVTEVVKMKKEKKPVEKKARKEKKPKEPKPKKTKKILTIFPKMEEGVDIMGLKRLSCRYPISANDVVPMLFCGKMQEHGSYCKEHGAICYYPPKYQSSNLAD